ncbi:MAG: DUF3137 domain-containing protein [Clostridia bacterium]|nr:DUF3137 domain-containing protein [Clostridia bacterium]
MRGICKLNVAFEEEIVITTSEFFGKLNYDRIKLDAPNFEREFNVYGNDKVVTLQILTSDIMQALSDIKQNLKFEFDIVIRRDKMYFRIHTGDIFEATMLRKSMNIENIRMCHNVLHSINQITELLCKEVEKNELM